MTAAEIIAQTVKSRTPLHKPKFNSRFGFEDFEEFAPKSDI